MCPGTKSTAYMAQGHAVNTPSKIMHAEYILPQLTCTNGYLVLLYSPLAYPNSATRYSGFQYYLTDTIASSKNLSHLAGLTMATTYGGDFNTFSVGGFVWAASASVRISAPAANLAGMAYGGRLNY